MERGAGPAVDAKAQLLAQLAMVEALLSDSPLRSLATLLIKQASSATSPLARPPAAPGPAPRSPRLPSLPLQRLLLDGAPFDGSPDHYLRIIERVFGEARGPRSTFAGGERQPSGSFRRCDPRAP